jgi:hypothetical protein
MSETENIIQSIVWRFEGQRNGGFRYPQFQENEHSFDDQVGFKTLSTK